MSDEEQSEQTYSPWTIVNMIFEHLVDQGFHPMLGDSGNPGAAAADLLRALGITPTAEGDRRIRRDTHQHLAELRATLLEEN